ncbi:MAG: hypothetical protein JWN04_1879 [Myxococcaceae bacterium]|nr:hypothetical protein [Myxococcaceae bacterium]
MVLGLALVLAAGCEREHVARYSSRGVVRGHEGVGDDARVAIQHEEIPRFEDRDGKTAPMHSMTMIFGLAKALQTRSFTPGTKLSFDFQVRWASAPFLVVTRVAPLAETTPLKLSDAHMQREP